MTMRGAGRHLIRGHVDYGSIEGRLRSVSEKGGLHFVVVEPIQKYEVRCYIPERLTDTAIANCHNRVEVYGLINYREDGKAASIHADEIVSFKPKVKLPSYLQVRGIFK